MARSLLCVETQPDDGSRCIGSSHGWLILFNQEQSNNLYLFSPSTGAKIQLPNLQQTLVHKAVLSADPGRTDEYLVIVICGFEKRIIFFSMGIRDRVLFTQWRDLVATKSISDVICRNNMMLTFDAECSFSFWDVQTPIFPRKIKDVKPTFRDGAFEKFEPMRDLCSCRWYVVECSGELLVVCRIVGEFVHNGEPISNPELLDGETNHPLVCPYRTLGFQVFKLDWSKNEYEEVKSIGADRALVLGGNHSVSVSRDQFSDCLGNSIYFTDDYWERMEEDYLYGGHDLGVYSLEDGNVKDFYEVDEKIEPPPFWVVPAAGSCRVRT